MEEQLISFETAKLAKEKGFDIHCRFYYDEEMLNVYENEDFPYNSWGGSLFAPTQSLLQKWLREIHNIDIVLDHAVSTGWYYRVYFKNMNWSTPFKKYEEALEQGLLEALKLIK